MLYFLAPVMYCTALPCPTPVPPHLTAATAGVQVAAAVQESSTLSASQAASGGAAGGGGEAPNLNKLVEGTEVSLLYVRFRAAAEPNLKGG